MGGQIFFFLALPPPFREVRGNDDQGERPGLSGFVSEPDLQLRDSAGLGLQSKPHRLRL